MKINLEFGKALALLNDFLMDHAKNATEENPYSSFTKQIIEEADKMVTKNETLLNQYNEYIEDFKQNPEPFASWENGSNEYD